MISIFSGPRRCSTASWRIFWGRFPVTATRASGVTTAPRRVNTPSCSTSVTVSNCSTRAISGSPRTPRARTRGWDAKYVRICCWGRFLDRQTKERFWFFTLHTDHKGERAQSESCRLALDQDPDDVPRRTRVLTGDFNVGETSESYAVLHDSGLLYDTFDLAEIKYAWTGTENGFDPDRKTFRHIDYVFVTSGFRVLRYGILTDTYRSEEPAGSAKPFRARTPSDPLPGEGRAGLYQVKFTVT